MITYGTNPGMGISVIDSDSDCTKRIRGKSLEIYGPVMLDNATSEIKVNYVFIGSCTNARIEDFRSAADYVKGRKKRKILWLGWFRGSQQVAKQIYDEGLDKVFNEAGFQI